MAPLGRGEGRTRRKITVSGMRSRRSTQSTCAASPTAWHMPSFCGVVKRIWPRPASKLGVAGRLELLKPGMKNGCVFLCAGILSICNSQEVCDRRTKPCAPPDFRGLLCHSTWSTTSSSSWPPRAHPLPGTGTAGQLLTASVVGVGSNLLPKASKFMSNSVSKCLSVFNDAKHLECKATSWSRNSFNIAVVPASSAEASP
mmetsp:Transcript_32642/g.86342  ORF Transcript_32642/g.86342 Transcript_32642/m.86342 type:complete len:200 (+) Transcript_32642:216-815(+)